MSVFNTIIRPNATVRIEKRVTSRDNSGGNVETYEMIEDNVPVLVSGTSSYRSYPFNSANETLSGTCTGNSSNLGKQNIRLYFKTGTFAGVYAFTEQNTPHGPAGDSLLPTAWYTVRWSQVRVG